MSEIEKLMSDPEALRMLAMSQQEMHDLAIAFRDQIAQARLAESLEEMQTATEAIGKALESFNKKYSWVIEAGKAVVDRLSAIKARLDAGELSALMELPFLDDLPRDVLPYLEREIKDMTADEIMGSVSRTIPAAARAYYEDTKDADVLPYILNISPDDLPALKKELTRRKYTLEDLEANLDDLIQAARKAFTVTAKRADKIEYPLDKLNTIMWGLTKKETAGRVLVNMAKQGTKKKIPLYYSINFDELEDVQISKELTATDKRVYIAMSALYNAGNEVMTITQIHHAMGNAGLPSKAQIDRINESVTKMSGARIHVDNQAEADAYNYKAFPYDGSLLPMERRSAIVNGQIVDAAIHLFREPPLMSFAKERGQVTAFKASLLQSPISKTEANLKLEDYLITRISRSKGTCKILLATLYEKAGITTKKQKQRVPEKIEKYLQTYMKEGTITGYKIGKEEVIITLPPK